MAQRTTSVETVIRVLCLGDVASVAGDEYESRNRLRMSLVPANSARSSMTPQTPRTPQRLAHPTALCFRVAVASQHGKFGVVSL